MKGHPKQYHRLDVGVLRIQPGKMHTDGKKLESNIEVDTQLGLLGQVLEEVNTLEYKTLLQ